LNDERIHLEADAVHADRILDAALAVHGRRYTDKFTGKADWGPIYELKKHVKIPVIGNGDILSADDAMSALGNLDGVMVGRGTFGNPWLLREICDVFFPSSPQPPSSFGSAQDRPGEKGERPFRMPVTFQEKIPFILEHCRLAVELKGEKWGMMEMRRHLASYVRGIPGAAAMRARLVRVETMAEVEEILTGATMLSP